MALILSLMAALAVPALGGPKGGDQQGTVKIHEGPGEPDPIMKNEPKVCDFHIHGFNFHDGEQIVWWIEEKGDQGWGDTVLSGNAVADTEGEWRDPEAAAYTLEPGHYKLYVDRAPEFDPPIKHKVFKIECEEEVSPTSIVTAPTTTTTTGPTTSTTTGAVGGIVVTGSTTTTIGDQVLGTVITGSTTAPGVSAIGDEVLAAEVQAEELPFTGVNSDWVIGVAVLLLAGGLIILGATGRREET